MKAKSKRIHEIDKRIRRTQSQLARLGKSSDRYVRARLGVFVVGVSASAAAFLLFGALPSWCLLASTLGIFFILVVAHRRVMGSIAKHEKWLAHHTAQRARAKLDWESIPVSRVRAPEKQHPFAADLDLVGDRSLHHLMNTAVSLEGSQRLADWLTAEHVDAAVVLQRQRLVLELLPLARFRDRLVLLASVDSGESARSWQVDDSVQSINPVHHVPQSGRLLAAMVVLSVITATLFVLYQFGLAPPLFVISWLVYVLLFVANTSRIRQLFVTAVDAETGLRSLAGIFGHIEQQHFQGTPHLQSLCAPFCGLERRPSLLLRRLSQVLAGASVQHIIYLWLPLNLIVPWDFAFAYWLERCERELADRMPVWLDVWHQLEALSSLANYGYLNPGASLPSITTGSETAMQLQCRASGTRSFLMVRGSSMTSLSPHWASLPW